MAKIVIQNDADPCIGIVLEELDDPRMPPGWFGKCTECGWPMHRWTREHAIEGAQRHVDAH